MVQIYVVVSALGIDMIPLGFFTLDRIATSKGSSLAVMRAEGQAFTLFRHDVSVILPTSIRVRFA